MAVKTWSAIGRTWMAVALGAAALITAAMADDTAGFLLRGQKALAAKDYEQAIDALRRAGPSPAARQALAQALDALAVQKIEAGRSREAKALLLEALEAAGETAERDFWLALSHVRDSEDGLARPYLEAALALDSAHAASLELLGFIEYRGNQTQAALGLWKRIPENRRSAAVRKLIERAEREAAMEQGFHTWETQHFRLLADADASSEAIRLVGDALEAAYAGIGYDLGVYPERPISALLYTQEAFRGLAGVDWAAGLFDGKIRLGLSGISLAQKDALFRLIRHEYAHVLIAEISSRVPSWIHEGLATLLDGAPIEDAKKRLKRRDTLPSLSGLSSSFTQFRNADEAQAAYDVSFLAIEAVVQRHGKVRLVDWLRETKSSSNAEAAYEKTFFTPFSDLESAVRESLR